jgi:hypothetical protein
VHHILVPIVFLRIKGEKQGALLCHLAAGPFGVRGVTTRRVPGVMDKVLLLPL